MSDLIYKDESYAIIGACFAVYKEKGCGFVEPVYQECLGIEFEHQKFSFLAQQNLNIYYRGRKLESSYKPDFICFDKIIIEIKAVNSLAKEHHAQVMNYLKATNYQLGLLVNFGHFPNLEYYRIAWSKKLSVI